jgi:hypothetical protein
LGQEELEEELPMVALQLWAAIHRLAHLFLLAGVVAVDMTLRLPPFQQLASGLEVD